MKKACMTFITAILLIFVTGGIAMAQVNININFGGPSQNDYYYDMSKYYRMPPGHLKKLQSRGLAGNEIPVVYYVASQARVEPTIIADLRLGGMNWLDISLRYGIPPSAYYIPVQHRPGPPYGKAYGYYGKFPKDQWTWKNMPLSNNDFINLVNLRFISDHNKVSPDEVIRLRSQGVDFINVNNQIKKGKPDKGTVAPGEGKGQKGGPPPGKGNKGGGKGKGK